VAAAAAASSARRPTRRRTRGARGCGTCRCRTAAKLAAERSSPEDVARLRLATDDLRTAGGIDFTRAERQFHLEVAAAAQSPRLTHEEVHLQSELGGLLWLPLGSAAPSCAEHAAITTAIEAADGELARELTEEHVLGALDRLADLHLDLLTP
jgi:GntR family transcriptional repressor for pyruvate dehydrogenase complex